MLDDLRALGRFDLILMRNVSIYFADAFKRRLFEQTAAALKPGGILVLGMAESLPSKTDGFERRTCGQTVYYVANQE